MSRRPRFEGLQRVDMTSSRLGAFIRTARGIAGRDASSPFSLEDVYSVAYQLGLSGVLFLEKLEDSRHVTVLLGLDESTVTLYDPLSGVRVRACNETQLGMYSRPVGTLRDEFREYERQFTPEERSDVWAQYRRTGKLLSRFLGSDSQSSWASHRQQDDRSHRGDGALQVWEFRRFLQSGQCAGIRAVSAGRRVCCDERQVFRLGQGPEEQGNR